MQKYPIHPILPKIYNAVNAHQRVIVQAPPGAGKTTMVPLHLLRASWLEKRTILLLEPRRIAARAACARMADLLGEKPGEQVGYAMRLEKRLGPNTRIQVVTEGVLTRRILSDPELSDVGLIIFDEFHERSLQADLGLALALDVQEGLREDLRILIMSATLDAESLVRVLGPDIPVITASGKSYPVTTRYTPPPAQNFGQNHTARVITRIMEKEKGNCLVFLPGAPEIHRLHTLLNSADLPKNIRVYPLFGNQSKEEQTRALAPAPVGTRKIVLATSIAETSLTIEGIRIVVDSGQSRLSRYSPQTGMNRLETVCVSKSSADQRRGRAGRLEPGTCYRLWSEATQTGISAHTPPEIENVDLCDLLLTLADWGSPDPSALTWITPPPSAHVQQARTLLNHLGALDNAGRITAYGRDIRRLGTHPRLAHLMLQGCTKHLGWTACVLAALLMERDLFHHIPGAPKDRDLRPRLDVVNTFQRTRKIPPHTRGETCRRIVQQAKIWARRLEIRPESIASDASGILLAHAFPDRIAFRRPGMDGQTYVLANGRGARFPTPDPLTVFPWLVIPELDGKGQNASIYLAAPVEQASLENDLPEMWSVREEYLWDTARKQVRPVLIRSLDAIEVSRKPLPSPDPERMAQTLLDALRHHGLELLVWKKSVLSWLNRVRFLHKSGMDIPDFQEETLLNELETWLYPFIAQDTRSLATIDLFQALTSRLTWEQLRMIDTHAPTHMNVPSGSRIPLEYSGDQPVLAVRIQEIFGWTTTPLLAKERIPLCIHLLSPAHRPVQITSDLAGFWKNGYPSVTKELKGRYPKHYWPEDPLTAQATKRTKKGMLRHENHQ